MSSHGTWQGAPTPDGELTIMPPTLDPSRDLLFGLLALQTGLINQAQLVAAFHAWTQARDRPMARILADQGALKTACVTLVEGLVIEHLRRHGGDPDRSLAAIGVGPSTRESLARIGDGELDASLGRVGSGRTEPDADRDRTASYSVGLATSDGQRFRVLRPHAKGGLGAVFVALDTELHREVALKQILDHHADDTTSRQRFLREAEITGGLEHPGIVPVYGLGTYGDGRPFYAMRFIEGDSLKEAIGHFHADEALGKDPGRRSLELRQLLRRFLDVCNAIGYAHSRGVLHRDLKPGNIIVGKHGETLVVDWGLAKPLGRVEPGSESGERTFAPSSASGSAETLPGSALGTPAYMSPEQARGELERLGPRSDVYSLGATLYCLLTGKPPFEDDDVGAILRGVQEGRFPRPRQLDPSLDEALEAVCLKAMATKSEGRYATPKALADDLERWMADEPVAAWSEPFTRRARRWMRRNRTAVTAAAVALFAALAGLGAVAGVQAKANGELKALNSRLNRSNIELAAEKARVQERFDLALEAIQTFHTGVSEDFLLKERQFKGLRERLLTSASDFYGKLAALLKDATDRPSQQVLLRVNFELAELTGKVGRYEDSLAAHRKVLAAREALAAGPAVDPKATVEVGKSLTKVALFLDMTDKTAEALATYRRAESVLARLAGTTPAARAALADCRSAMGESLFRTGKSPEALAAYRLARPEQEELASAPGAAKETRYELGITVFNIGTLLSETGRPREGAAEIRKAMAVYQKLADDFPAVSDYRDGLAKAHNNLSTCLFQEGRRPEAEAELRAALAVWQKLVDEYPAATTLVNNTGFVRNRHGLMLQAAGRPAEAEAEFRKALAMFRRLVDDDPGSPFFRKNLAVSHDQLGVLLHQAGRLSEAEAELREGLAIRKKLADDNPRVRSYPASVATSHSTISDLLLHLRRFVEARDGYDQAIAIREALVKDNLAYRGALAASLRGRGLARLDLGDPAGAGADIRRALGICESLPARSGEEWFESACSHAALAGLAGRDGSGASSGAAASEADTAVTLLTKAVGLGYRNANAFRTETALDPLRDRPDFRLLMMDLTFPAEPFALVR
jgi:serine/threonine-protein kinase